MTNPLQSPPNLVPESSSSHLPEPIQAEILQHEVMAAPKQNRRNPPIDSASREPLRKSGGAIRPEGVFMQRHPVLEKPRPEGEITISPHKHKVRRKKLKKPISYPRTFEQQQIDTMERRQQSGTFGPSPTDYLSRPFHWRVKTEDFRPMLPGAYPIPNDMPSRHLMPTTGVNMVEAFRSRLKRNREEDSSTPLPRIPQQGQLDQPQTDEDFLEGLENLFRWQQHQILRLEFHLKGGHRQLYTGWYNSAEASPNPARRDPKRAWAFPTLVPDLSSGMCVSKEQLAEKLDRVVDE
eukprot:Platyproteum_vivax@DN2525_c0_g1_i1.p1